MNIVIQLIIGFLLADFITGLLHWFEDVYLYYCMDIPIIGDISKDNEMHHYFPRSIIAYSYIENITISYLLTIIVIYIIYFLNKPFFIKYIYLIISFGIFASFSNAIHKHAHMRDCENPWWLLLFHKTGLICSHEHHKEHHNNPTKYYCVISEYNNYILESVDFWRKLETLIEYITGIKPLFKPSYNSYNKIFTNLHENAKLECPDNPTKDHVEKLKIILSDYKKCQQK